MNPAVQIIFFRGGATLTPLVVPTNPKWPRTDVFHLGFQHNGNWNSPETVIHQGFQRIHNYDLGFVSGQGSAGTGFREPGVAIFTHHLGFQNVEIYYPGYKRINIDTEPA